MTIVLYNGRLPCRRLHSSQRKMSSGVLRRQSLTQVSEYPHSVVYGVAVVHACVKGLPATLFLSALRGACNDLQTFLMVLSRRNPPPRVSRPLGVLLWSMMPPRFLLKKITVSNCRQKSHPKEPCMTAICFSAVFNIERIFACLPGSKQHATTAH